MARLFDFAPLKKVITFEDRLYATFHPPAIHFGRSARPDRLARRLVESPGSTLEDVASQEARVVEEGRRHYWPAGPDRRDPGEGDRARDGDRERGAAEEREREKRNAGGEHMVQPDAEAERHGRDR
jgi:hypothetical protein